MYGKIFCRLFFSLTAKNWEIKEDNIKAKNFAVCVVSITAMHVLENR